MAVYGLSQTDRILSSKKGSSTLCVLVDANNYIRGYRYEMYCLAKATRQQQAIVYCTTSEATCRANNAQVSPSFILSLLNLAIPMQKLENMSKFFDLV